MPSSSLLLWPGLGSAAFWVLACPVAWARLRDLLDLPLGAGAVPPVTLCIPARNEEKALGPALASWLAQEAPDLRIVVVDDGSRDATPALLAQRVREHPDRLRVLRVDDLPEGWLGKNHALHLASSQPEALSSPWLLFADADVVAAPDLLKRAFAFLAAHPGDLLALVPAVDTVGLVERSFMPWATLALLWAIPFRRVPQAGSWAHCGVGAFTLVRREAYDAVRGHAGDPLEPIDDMGLARRVKAAGFVNQAALAGPALRLRMYDGLGDLVRGMRKNVLPLPILIPLAPLVAAAVLAGALGPLLLAGAGHPWGGAALWLLVVLTIARVQARFTGRKLDPAWFLWPLNGFPLAAGFLWAAADRLRGVNHWRGREIKLGPGTRQG